MKAKVLIHYEDDTMEMFDADDVVARMRYKRGSEVEFIDIAANYVTGYVNTKNNREGRHDETS